MDFGITIREALLRSGKVNDAKIDELLSPKRMRKLGFTEGEFDEI